MRGKAERGSNTLNGEKTMTKRAAIYARVSTDDQAAKGYSIPTQLAACREYAQRQGWAVAAEYADDCSGTFPVRERPEGKRLYQDVAAGKIEAVVLYTIDRAARDEDVIEFLNLQARYEYSRSRVAFLRQWQNGQ